MTTYATRNCECKVTTGVGGKRPELCDDHGNRFQTAAELKPRQRTPLRPISPKREAEEAAGTRKKRQRGSTLNRGKGFEASPAQRAKVRGLPCVGCGREATEDGRVTIDPAHVWPQGKGGCKHPDCVLGLCRGFDYSCHTLFDEGKLDLLPRLAASEAWATEQAHPILCHGVTVVELARRLAGNQQELVWVSRDQTNQPERIANA